MGTMSLLKRSVRSLVTLAMALFALASLNGCASHTWVIQHQAQPDPFVGATQFAVAPIDYGELRVGDKTESDYLAGKNPEQRNAWAGDKLTIDSKFDEALAISSRDAGLQVATSTTGAPFVLHPKVIWLEPGYQALVANRASEARMLLSVTGPDGKELDAIELHEDETTGYSTRTRFESVANKLARTTAAYLASRASPK